MDIMTWGTVIEIKKYSLEAYDSRGAPVFTMYVSFNHKMLIQTHREKRGQFKVQFLDAHITIPRVKVIRVHYDEDQIIENVLLGLPFIQGDCPVEFVKDIEVGLINGNEQTD